MSTESDATILSRRFSRFSSGKSETIGGGGWSVSRRLQICEPYEIGFALVRTAGRALPASTLVRSVELRHSSMLEWRLYAVLNARLT